MESRMRLKDAPMDYEFTDRPSFPGQSSWKASSVNPTTPKKRSHDDSVEMTPADSSSVPKFGNHLEQHTPFMFSSTPTRSEPYHWTPNSHVEPKDVDMTEPSPVKQEDDSPAVTRAVALGAVQRVYKSRQKLRASRSVRRLLEDEQEEEDIGDSGSEDDDGRVALRRQNTSNHYTLNMPSQPAPQSDTPYILIGYLQFFFNLSLALLFLYLVVQFIYTVQRDVEHRISEYSMDIVQEISLCALQYKQNLCAGNAVPAMAHQCGNWETCMNRDPSIVGRARVGAELIAEVVNGFVEPISWKALIFTITSLTSLTLLINALLSLYRSKHQPLSAAAPAPLQHQHSFPATPYPSHHFGYLSPAPTPSWGRHWVPPTDQDMQTPTRKRRLDGGLAAKIK